MRLPLAATQIAARHHVGEGRFTLNIVAGWNEGEFEMFGVKQHGHEKRYEFAQEWIDIVKQAWAEEEDFDFDGENTITGANACSDVLTVAGCNLSDERVGYSSQGPGIAGMASDKPDLAAYTHFRGSEALGTAKPAREPPPPVRLLPAA